MTYNKRTSKRKPRRGGTKKNGSIIKASIKKYAKNPKPVEITNRNIRHFVEVYLNKGQYTEDLPINLRGIPIGKWDVSNVTDMSKLFLLTTFNEDISNWDVSNVTTMESMFHSAFEFDQSLENWIVSNVTNMSGMFSNASKFNQPLDNWDVSKVTDMSFMFSLATNFNQPLNIWDVSKVTDMSFMFSLATSFNQSLNIWDVSNVKKMESIFKDCPIEQKNFENWEFNVLPEETIVSLDNLYEVYTRYQFMMTSEEKNILHNANNELRNKYISSINKAKFLKDRKEILKLMDKLNEKYKTKVKHFPPKTSAEKRHERNLDMLLDPNGPGRDLLEYIGPSKYRKEK
jgi:surface protein